MVLSARGFYDRNVCASAERVEIRNKVQVAKIRAYKASNERNYRAENYMNTLRKSLKVRGNSDLPLSVWWCPFIKVWEVTLPLLSRLITLRAGTLNYSLHSDILPCLQ